jgi:16S rRNA (uracil1498-N3)-methyltransferase
MTERLRRAYLPEPPAAGGRARLDREEAHHVARVLRLARGDTLAVFDGRGGEWEATLDAVSRDEAWVMMGEPRGGSVEAPLPIVLLQALTRPEKLEWVLQKGTELGVAAFRLVPTARVEAPAPTPARLERYRKIVLEAVKQCGRRVIPAVDVVPIADIPAGAAGLLLDPSPGAPPLGRVLSGLRPGAVAIAVGPEGGFAPEETASLAARGWRPAGLGPRTLRTETAGAVAAAIVLHLWGDLGAAGPSSPPA